MKKITILIFTVVITVTTKAQLQKTIFVGLNHQPLALNGGLELTQKIKNVVHLFVRPTYNNRNYGSRTGTLSYMDIPFGVKIKVGETNENGTYDFNFSIGPYIAYALKGKYRPTVGAAEQNINFGTGPGTQFDDKDYGIFANTQINFGLFGFGIAAQRGFKKQDLSRLGLSATSNTMKAPSLYTLSVNFNLPGKKIKEINL